jgi:hypothetical protein
LGEGHHLVWCDSTTTNAAGVIGTEITIFEPLACTFAEKFAALFLAGVPIGEAVRRVRLAILSEENPLGLVYIPFVLASAALGPVGSDS